MLSIKLLLAAGLAQLASAHFLLDYPKSIGFNDDKESTSPCGGFTPDLSKDKLQDIHVGGEAIAVTLTHQQGDWLFRVTTDDSAKSGWEQVYPIVRQSGLGAFCVPDVTIPEKYAGKKGILSIVSKAEDGLLYQCVAANFVKGSAHAPSACKNASSVKTSFVEDRQLSALVGSSKASSSASASSSSKPSKTGATAAASTSSSSAASWLNSNANMGSAASLLAMTLVGAALMI